MSIKTKPNPRESEREIEKKIMLRLAQLLLETINFYHIIY